MKNIKNKKNILKTIGEYLNPLNNQITFAILFFCIVSMVVATFTFVFNKIWDRYGFDACWITFVSLAASFIIAYLVVIIMRIVNMCYKFAHLPLTQEEFDVLTQDMSLDDCLLYFSKCIAYKACDEWRYYPNLFTDYYDEMVSLCEMIGNKYHGMEHTVNTYACPLLLLAENEWYRTNQRRLQDALNFVEED